MSMSMTYSYGTTRGGLALIHGSVLLAGIAVRRACYGIDMVGDGRYGWNRKKWKESETTTLS